MKSSIKNATSTKFILVLLGILLFSYTTARCFLLSITWDEAYTYIEFISKGVLFPVNNLRMSPNYHLLLTLLDIKLVNLFGVSEFVLRLPSLFGHLLFLFYAAKLVFRFDNKLVVILSFLIINLNPYMLDYFSLARGYGLSLGFMMASIYYLYLFYFNFSKNRYAVFCLVSAALATLSNLVLFNLFLVLYCLIILLKCNNIASTEKNIRKRNAALLKVTVFNSLIIYAIVLLTVPVVLTLKLTIINSYGGYSGLWSDTLSETINTNFYGLPFTILLHWVVKAVVLLVFICCCYLSFSILRKKENTTKSFIPVLLSIIVLSAFATSLQHYSFGTLYLTNRTALFLIVLFNLLIVFFLNDLINRNKRFILISTLIALVSITHFSYSFNFKYVLDWKTDADTKTMFSDLQKIKNTANSADKKLFISPTLEEAFSFYTAIDKKNGLNINSNFKSVNQHDYLLLDEQSFISIKDSVDVIKHYPTSNNVLAKPKIK